jgi:hypothetical protein
MIDYKVQVRLPNGQVSDFTSFVVNHPTNGFSKEFDDLELAKEYIQQIDQEFLRDFMISHNSFIDFSKNDQLKIIYTFISWYANLDVFDKSEFLKLLQKVHKIEG